MADTNESKTSRCSRDLLQRFNESVESTSYEVGVSEEIELNLGLSLGGRFGVDKSESKKLIRSSSIAECFPMVRDEDSVNLKGSPVLNPTLIRTSSLPVETEVEWRKRKELQTLRRLAAKRRRSEKQRNKDGGGGGGASLERSFEDEKVEIEANLRGRVERDQYLVAGNRLGPAVMPPFGCPNWAAAARQAILAAGGGVQGFGQPSPRGSMESQGGSSSGVSDLESKPLQGSSSCGDGSPASIQSLQGRSNHEAVGSAGSKNKENEKKNKNRFSSISEMVTEPKRPDFAKSQGKEVGVNALEDMPCVFAKGDGANGRRVEGILYKYGKGEEVRIMCVCHGIFLSPADFVKHAGCTDVANPLKHIVMNPNSPSSFS